MAVGVMLAVGLSLIGISVAALLDPPLRSRIEALLGGDDEEEAVEG